MTDELNDQVPGDAEPTGGVPEADGATPAERAGDGADERLTPEQVGDAVVRFATDTAYAAAGLANVIAEKAREFYEAQRKQIAEKTPDGVDPNFRQFVDGLPEQFKGFMDEATRAFHDMAERGRSSVTELQHQMQAARDAAREARSQVTEPFDLMDDASATAEAADAVAPDEPEEAVEPAAPEASEGEVSGS